MAEPRSTGTSLKRGFLYQVKGKLIPDVLKVMYRGILIFILS